MISVTIFILTLMEEKKISRAIANTSSGITIGIYRELLIRFFSLNSNLYSPSAQSVPITTDRIVLQKATITVLKKDCISCRFSNIRPYHSKVKP